MNIETNHKLPKKYACRRCGHTTELVTNHFGSTWSVGHFNTCPNCPPWAKYPEFGGQTVWECQTMIPNAKTINDHNRGKRRDVV
jgi:hypothetical protein